MKIKPKEVLLNLPITLMFRDYHEIPAFAENINQLINGRIKLKYEELGCLGGQYVGLFYLKRDPEFSELREEFTKMIEEEEQYIHNSGRFS
jgi:hypothetical protein